MRSLMSPDLKGRRNCAGWAPFFSRLMNGPSRWKPAERRPKSRIFIIDQSDDDSSCLFGEICLKLYICEPFLKAYIISRNQWAWSWELQEVLRDGQPRCWFWCFHGTFFWQFWKYKIKITSYQELQLHDILHCELWPEAEPETHSLNMMQLSWTKNKPETSFLKQVNNSVSKTQRKLDIMKLNCWWHLVVNSRRRRDQRGTERRHAVLQDLFGHEGNSTADVLAGLREVDAVSTCRETTMFF